MVTSSSQENTRKISKQFLLFGIILVRSPCHYYEIKKKPALLLPVKKCGHTSQLSKIIYCMYLYCAGVIIAADIFT